jgi:hypothetical protein
VNRLQHALELASRGFHIFPCEPNGKLPLLKDFPNRATRDPEQIRKWFEGRDCNIGISTTKFGDDAALVVVDVDNKSGKHGDAQLLALELEGCELPASFEQTTPSGGRHIVYVAQQSCRQGVNILGEGLDVCSRGGYIVGPGSEIDGKSYRQIDGRCCIASAPGWLVDRLGADRERPAAGGVVLDGVNADRARHRAVGYLGTAPVSIEGNAGDQTAYKVAARLKDLGCNENQAFDLLCHYWNDRCEPPWSHDELVAKVAHAFKYGREPQGVGAPEAVFTSSVKDEDEASHPVDALNNEYAFIKSGAFVLQETTDHKGRFTTIRLTPSDMHAWFSNKTLQVSTPQGNKPVPLSKLWMARPSRREYDSVVFSPLNRVQGRFYNLWRGFSVEPAATGEHPSVDQFLEHALQNVCNNDEALYRWLLGYFAHAIQRPFEKPLVALVFKGDKGTGKNALVERVGALLGPHFLVADDERYLLSNFNSHLESNLFFVLDEASWAGDKRAEGKLKGLITGSRHNIERKGHEPYQVDNLTRVAILGNEKWLIPATVDERRFAVFNVGNGRRQDRKFFEEMRLGMERGGYACLLRFLMDYDLSGVDVNAAPCTQGLIDQKHASLAPIQEWWLDCITSDSLVGSDWEGALPALIPTNRIRSAFEQWAKGRNIRSRLPGRNEFMGDIKTMAPSFTKVKARPEDPEDATYSFKNPGVAELRGDWDRFIGGSHDWSN